MDPNPDPAQAAADLLRDAFAGAENGASSERRVSERHDYPFIQWVAPSSDPDVELKGLRFFPARCLDLSRGGISFQTPIPPTFRYVVVKLGTTNDPVHVLAEVVRFDSVEGADNEHIVGCRFLRKMSC